MAEISLDPRNGGAEVDFLVRRDDLRPGPFRAFSA